MHHARARDNRLGRAAIVFAPALAVAALAGHPSGSHPSVVKGAGHRVTLQVTLSGTIKGRLSNLHAGHGFSCARAAVGSPFVLGEVHGTVGGVRYRFSVGTDVYQGPGRQPDANADLGRLDQDPRRDYFEAGSGTTDALRMSSPTAGRFSIDLTAPNTGFRVTEHAEGQFRC